MTVKVRLASMKQKIESFGNNRYLVSLLAKDHAAGNAELMPLMSKYLGTPMMRIALRSGTDSEDKVLEVE